MSKQLRMIMKQQPTGREETPWLEPYRERFARVSRECKEHFKNTKLTGVEKVRAYNAFMSQHLKEG